MKQSLVVRAALFASALVLSACAGYSGSNLKPGTATLPEVIASMGEPAMRWQDASGSEQLAYPRGPAGTQTFMAFIGADGRLERIEGVLDMAHFARIEAGKSDQAAVLRLLGPSQPQWTVYFERRDELAWEWKFCDDWGHVARFGVLFDATNGIVRTSYQAPDLAIGWMGIRGVVQSCGH